MHVYVCACMRTCMHACVRMCVFVFVFMFVCMRVQSCLCACVHVCVMYNVHMHSYRCPLGLPPPQSPHQHTLPPLTHPPPSKVSTIVREPANSGVDYWTDLDTSYEIRCACACACALYTVHVKSVR